MTIFVSGTERSGHSQADIAIALLNRSAIFRNLAHLAAKAIAIASCAALADNGIAVGARRTLRDGGFGSLRRCFATGKERDS